MKREKVCIPWDYIIITTLNIFNCICCTVWELALSIRRKNKKQSTHFFHKSPHSCQQLCLEQNTRISRYGDIWIIRVDLGEGWICWGRSLVPSKTIEEKCTCLLREVLFHNKYRKQTRCHTCFLSPETNILVIRHTAGSPKHQFVDFPHECLRAPFGKSLLSLPGRLLL